MREGVHEAGMEMKRLPGKIKQRWFFHEVTKRGVGKQRQRRETRVTWAGPGRGGGSRRAAGDGVDQAAAGVCRSQESGAAWALPPLGTIEEISKMHS